MSGPEHIDAADAAESGKTYHLSGDFRGAIVNIESTFVNSAVAHDIETLPPEPGDPPYKGLQYFDEADADHFLGRETLTARLAGRLRETRFLAVIGASGSGKSSVVRAGLVPALRRGKPLADGALPPAGSEAWLIRVMTPTAHPLDALAVALLPDGEPAAVAALRDKLSEDPAALAAAAASALDSAAFPHLLLVVDQFEEVFSLARQEAERRTFIDNLVATVAADVPVHVVIVLRADFYAQCAQYEGLRELVSRNQEFIGAMSREELFRVIVMPAARDNWKIQEGLVELMLDDAGDEPGALPLLSHALLETWRRRRGRTMTLSGYKESGGVRGAIAKTAETVFRQRLTPEQRPVARMIFVRLTELGETPDSDTPDTRRRAQFSELITRATDATMLDAVLQILVDSRLVMTDVVPPGETKVVEVSHEALIREWPTLRDWLNQDRAGLIRHRQLTADVNDWLNLNRDPGALYRGARLEQTLAWSAESPDPLSVTELEFLEASRAAAAEEARRAERLARAARTQRVLVGVAALLLVGVIVALLYGLDVFTPQPPPEKMSGEFGIAVAEFLTLNNTGRPVKSDGGQRLADRVAGGLAAELGDDPAFQVWVDSPELFETHHVEIGPAAEGLDGIEEPAAMADRLGADVVVYGRVAPEANGVNTLRMDFYPAPLYNLDLTRFIGRHELVRAIPVFDAADPGSEVWSRLDPQTQSLAWILRGLQYLAIGRDGEALAAFERAAELAPDSDLAYYFVGQQNIYLAQAGETVEPERLAAAAAAFDRALQLNPNNDRARIGQGSVHFVAAQGMLDETKRPDFAGDRNPQYERVLAEAEKALAAYRPIAAGDEQLETYGVPVASMANYEAGIALRLMADTAFRAGDAAGASAYIRDAAGRLEAAVGPLADTGNSRLTAMAYQALGTVYELEGFLLAQEGDPAAPAANEKALANYRACAAVGEEYPFDVFMVEHIVQALCLPRLEALGQAAGGGQ